MEKKTISTMSNAGFDNLLFSADRQAEGEYFINYILVDTVEEIGFEVAKKFIDQYCNYKKELELINERLRG